MRKNTKIEMPCGNGKTLEREFIKAYTIVHRIVRMLNMKRQI